MGDAGARPDHPTRRGALFHPLGESRHDHQNVVADHPGTGRDLRACWHARQRNTGWLEEMSLGTGGETWAWLLSYDRQAEAEAVSVGMHFKF